jgi:bifunctional UDP-N-acetylglucosamine pyrophosphorylase/glucosamine-1-phosphate N-acetyltransferase
MGVNDRVALAEAEAILRRRLLRDLMLSGVTVEDPATTYVEAGVRVGQDTLLRPGTMLRGATVIGERCEIGPNSVIQDSTIGDDCLVLASWLEGAVMESGSRVGPMSRLRPGARLKPGAYVGNFGEVKNSTLGDNVQMHHFSYMGDATVGASTNVGAGTVTMNYDGRAKHHTTIGEGVFLGCDTLLRAPVSVGDGAATGGGAVVTRDVAPGKLVVGMPARPIRRVSSAASARDAGTDGTPSDAADAAYGGTDGSTARSGTTATQEASDPSASLHTGDDASRVGDPGEAARDTLHDSGKNGNTTSTHDA